MSDKHDGMQPENREAASASELRPEGYETAAESVRHEDGMAHTASSVVDDVHAAEAATTAKSGGPDTGMDSSTANTVEDNATATAACSLEGTACRCAKVFNGLAKIGPLFLIVALALMLWPDFWQPEKALYCPAETGTLSAFLHGVSQGSWLTPTAFDGSHWSLPQWPVFYWFMGCIAAIPMVGELNLLLPLAGAIAAFLAIFAVWCLSMSARFGGAAALAAGIILLCSPLFAPLPHFIGPAALGSSLMIFALACFAHGWQARRAWFSLPLAFIFTTLAGMCCGLMFFVIPLGASLLYLIWRGRLRRAQTLDAMVGFILMLAIGGTWLGMVILDGNSGDYLPILFSSHTRWAIPPAAGWWIALLLAALGTLPWILMIFGVSWIKVLAAAPKTLGASRRDNGSALVWISLVLACGWSIFETREHFAAVAIICLLAPLFGKAFMHLSSMGNRFFFLLVAICLFVAGIAILCASFSFTQNFLWEIPGLQAAAAYGPIMLASTALPIIGAICVLGGIILALLCVRTFRQGGGLVFCLLLTIIICQPALLMLVPELSQHPAARLSTFEALQQRLAPALENFSQPPAPFAPAPEQTLPETVEPAPGTAPEEAPVQVAPPAQSGAESVPPSVETPEQAVPGPEDAATGTQAVPESGDRQDTPEKSVNEAVEEAIIVEEQPAVSPPAQQPAPSADEPANP